MENTKGNLALLKHLENQKELHLFEYIAKGQVRYVSECRCLGFHSEEAPDRNGELRQAIVFELELFANSVASKEPTEDPKWSLTEEHLGRLAISSSVSSSASERKVNVYRRSEAVRFLALKRSGGVCQGCQLPAPFVDRRSRPFLEVHHLYRMSDGGPDHPNNVVAICPNCHRRVHQGKDGKEFNEKLVAVRIPQFTGSVT